MAACSVWDMYTCTQETLVLIIMVRELDRDAILPIDRIISSISFRVMYYLLSVIEQVPSKEHQSSIHIDGM